LILGIGSTGFKAPSKTLFAHVLYGRLCVLHLRYPNWIRQAAPIPLTLLNKSIDQRSELIRTTDSIYVLCYPQRAILPLSWTCQDKAKRYCEDVNLVMFILTECDKSSRGINPANGIDFAPGKGTLEAYLSRPEGVENPHNYL
jgi:hypothetical protein